MSTENKKIILIYPVSDTDLDYPGAEFDHDGYKCVPPGVLSIASVVEAAGYEPKVIDCRLYPKAECEKILLTELETAFLVGFSVMTCQIRHALKLSELVRSNSKLPIAWGGIHPSLFPEETIKDELIDYVVYGEGENTLLKLIKCLDKKEQDLSSVKGLVWGKDNAIINNGPDEITDINALPMANYALLDIDKYIDRRLIQGGRVRGLDIITSRGCPYRCRFCTNTFLLGKKWRGLELDKIKQLIDKLVSEYKLNNLWFVDDFFFGQKDRPLEIARHIKEKHGAISWEADIRSDNFRDGFVDDKYLIELSECGCHSLRMGAESGSDRVLKMIKKDVTTKQVRNAVSQCVKHDINPVLFFMIGIPGESIEEAVETVRFIHQIKEEFPRAYIFGPGVFRPYPGSELYNELKDSGFKAPGTLREWNEDLGGYLNTSRLGWLKDKSSFIENLMFYNNMYLAYRHQHSKPGLRWFFGALASLRMRFNFWCFPIEARIVSWYKRMKKR